MPTHIGLYKLTDQGIKSAKDAPGRVEDAIKGAEAMGGKVIGVYAVMWPLVSFPVMKSLWPSLWHLARVGMSGRPRSKRSQRKSLQR